MKFYTDRYGRVRPITPRKSRKNSYKRPKFTEEPRSKMHDYIALNYENTRLAKKFHIKPNEVIVRSDWAENPYLRKRLNVHENVELYDITIKHIPKKKAHQIANIFEHTALKVRGRK
jgi:hypothetical protein